MESHIYHKYALSAVELHVNGNIHWVSSPVFSLSVNCLGDLSMMLPVVEVHSFLCWSFPLDKHSKMQLSSVLRIFGVLQLEAFMNNAVRKSFTCMYFAHTCGFALGVHGLEPLGHRHSYVLL